MKNLFAMLLFLLLSSPAAGVFAQTRTDAVLRESPETVLDTELQLLGGKTLKLSEYSGNVMVISLFATWCGPCRYESPDLAKLYNEFKKRSVVVIELSTEDPEASKESVREWAWEFRLPYPVGWATRDLALTLMQGRTSIPQTLVVARDGRIVKRFIGYDQARTLSLMRKTVEEALL